MLKQDLRAILDGKSTDISMIYRDYRKMAPTIKESAKLMLADLNKVDRAEKAFNNSLNESLNYIHNSPEFKDKDERDNVVYAFSMKVNNSSYE